MSSPARDIWPRSLGDPATHFDALLGVAAEAAGEGDFARALRFADRTRRLAPGSADCARLCALLYLRLGQPAAGLRVLSFPRLEATPEIEEARARLQLAASVEPPLPFEDPSPRESGARPGERTACVAYSDEGADGFAATDRPSVLVVTHGWGGGVERHLAERAAKLESEGLRVLMLTGPPRAARARVAILSAWGKKLSGLEFRLSDEVEDLLALLAALAIGRVEVHHFIGLGGQLEAILERLGAPYEVVVHDYGWFCPRIVLVGGDQKYCGEPTLAACEDCVARHGSLIEEDISVADLRARSTRILAAAARVTTPSNDAARRIAARFPGLSPAIGAWEPTLPDPPPTRRLAGARVRVGLIGAIGEHKGFERLRECALDAARRDLPLDFVVIGYSADDPGLFATGRVFVTGPYEEGEAAGLIEREGCDVLFFASIWPETWCYALSHGLASGLPILAFDLGAIGERLRGVGRARLVSPELSAGELNAALLGLARPDDAEPADDDAWLEARFGNGETVSARAGEWAQARDGASWLGAFRVRPPRHGALQYRARFRSADESPWSRPGDWCGRGAALRPIFALATQGTGEDREPRHRLGVRFSSGLEVEGAELGGACASPLANDPIVGLRVTAS